MIRAIRHQFAEMGTQMADAADWDQRDDYYWAGPAGWTICRVYVDNRWQYEIWSASGVRHGMEASLAKAIQLYERVKPA